MRRRLVGEEDSHHDTNQSRQCQLIYLSSHRMAGQRIADLFKKHIVPLLKSRLAPSPCLHLEYIPEGSISDHLRQSCAAGRRPNQVCRLRHHEPVRQPQGHLRNERVYLASEVYKAGNMERKPRTPYRRLSSGCIEYKFPVWPTSSNRSQQAPLRMTLTAEQRGLKRHQARHDSKMQARGQRADSGRHDG